MSRLILPPIFAASGALVGIVAAPHLAEAVTHLGGSPSPLSVGLLCAGLSIPVTAFLAWVAPGGPGRKERFLHQWQDGLEVRERLLSDRETRVAAHEARVRDLLRQVQEQASEVNSGRHAAEQQARQLAEADVRLHEASAELERRRAEFDLMETLAEAVQAQADIERQRVELRDERAALTGERIALDAVRTDHATKVREASETLRQAEAARTRKGPSVRARARTRAAAAREA